MDPEVEPGYYWANVYYRFWNKWEIEIIERRIMNEIDEEADDYLEHEWFSCGSDVPLIESEFKLLPHDGPLKPPSVPASFDELKAIDPHPVLVDAIKNIHPVRDNDSGQ